MRGLLRIGCLAAILFLAVGCSSGPRTYWVTGSATFNGQPIEKGDIIFVAADGNVSPNVARFLDERFRFLSREGKKKIGIRPPGAIGKKPWAFSTMTTFPTSTTGGRRPWRP